MLQELIAAGKIKPRTKWKQIYPSFANDERYLNILGNPGSNPLELFWDVVDNLDQKLESKIAVAESAINRYNERLMDEDGGTNSKGDKPGFKVGPETSEDAFLDIIKADEDADVKKMNLNELKEIFHSVSLLTSFIACFFLTLLQMHEAVLKQYADEKRRAERKLRHLQDDLRYALKKLPEPLDLNLSYEEVRFVFLLSFSNSEIS